MISGRASLKKVGGSNVLLKLCWRCSVIRGPCPFSLQERPSKKLEGNSLLLQVFYFIRNLVKIGMCLLKPGTCRLPSQNQTCKKVEFENYTLWQLWKVLPHPPTTFFCNFGKISWTTFLKSGGKQTPHSPCSYGFLLLNGHRTLPNYRANIERDFHNKDNLWKIQSKYLDVPLLFWKFILKSMISTPVFLGH